MPNKITKAASKVTQRKGTYSGKGMLTAELLAGFVIILIRIIADFTVDDSTGTLTSNVLHNSSTYGPFPIAIGLIGVFFVLSFLAASGGNKAKLAVIFGGVVVLALGVKSVSEIDKIAGVIGNIGTYQVPAPSGQESSGASNPNTTVTTPGPTSSTFGSTPPGTTNIAPTPTGSQSPTTLITNPNPTSIFPTITPGSPPANINGGPGNPYPTTLTPVPSSGPGSSQDPLQ